jgi:hypothetical protein
MKGLDGLYASVSIFLGTLSIFLQPRDTHYYTGCRFTPYPISDSIWLSHGFFLVGSGNQTTVYGEPKFLGRKHTKWDIKQDREEESLFEYVARQNGPLEDYNPQMILQCLLWGTSAFVHCLTSVNY